MPDLNMATVRQQFPQYNDLSDDQLAQGLHDKFYKDMPFDTFASKIGYSQAPPPTMGVEGMVGFPTIGGPQTQIGADVNALAQGAVGGTGGIVSGVGRTYQEAGPRMANSQLAVMNDIDRGLTVPDQQDIMGYQYLSPEQRAKARADLGGAKDELEAREPNALMRAGRAVQGFGQSAFPVDPALEGRQTGIARMIGGAGPVLAAGALGTAVGGPGGGMLASMAAVGSQTYDATYQEAIGKGQTPEQADDAAGKAAMGQAIIMTVPLARIIPRVPMDLREGLIKTLVNLGQNGVEFSAGNTLGTVVNNYVAQQSFDPKRGLMDGTQDAALEGFVAGLVIPSTVNAAQRIAESARTAAPPIADVIKPVLDAPDVETAVRAAGDVINTDPATDARASDLYQRVNQATAPGPATEARDTAAATAATAQARETAAGREEPPPVPYRPVTAAQVQARDGGTIDAAFATAQRENAAGAANQPAMVPPGTPPPLLPRIMDLLRETDRQEAQRPAMVPPTSTTDPLTGQTTPITPPPPEQTMPIPGTRPPIAPPPVPTPDMTGSVGAAASREGTPAADLLPTPSEADSIRQQGEIERLAMPPRPGDKTVYIKGADPTLAEVTGDPVVAMEQAYNRQQPVANPHHVERETRAADAITEEYANTAGAKITLDRMEEKQDLQAQADIKKVFGEPGSQRPPADPSSTLRLMDDFLDDPRHAERNSIVKILEPLRNKFYDADGDLKTDPYTLYGIGEHINDLLNGVGDTETIGSARALKRELTMIKNDLYNRIEDVAPGFAEYRANYARAASEIAAMRFLQENRLRLLNANLRITPAKWFGFMRDVIEGRGDPMDPAYGLSEAQMDRLWNITDHVKRQMFLETGKPRGSWTSMMQEMGERFGEAAAHAVVGHAVPVFGNIGVKMGTSYLRKRHAEKEMQRFLYPDLSE